jgi:hypothetical protein
MQSRERITFSNFQICKMSLYETSDNNMNINKMYRVNTSYIQDYNNIPTTRHLRIHIHIQTEIRKRRH